MSPALLFTVEHGDNKVPDEFAHLFSGAESVLASHRGYDPGAGELAIRFSTRFHAPYEHAEITRLLIDQNRSRNNRRALFSEYTRDLSHEEKERIVDVCYWPYQYLVRRRVETLLAESATVLHLAIHSFTPELKGAVRNCDVGLMYDPSREAERAFCRHWQDALLYLAPDLRVRRNYPYRGVSDGIVPALRRQFPAASYVGLQIEINQRFPFGDREEWKRLQKNVVESFSRGLEQA
jgi:predicted N-formylglutamate amidohydrolase